MGSGVKYMIMTFIKRDILCTLIICFKININFRKNYKMDTIGDFVINMKNKDDKNS